jgi:hypothetical protein
MVGYTIALSDSIGSSMIFFPTGETLIYKKLQEAREALNRFVVGLNLVPILYGETFPYDTTTFESELELKGFAVYGIVDYVIDGEACRIPIGLKVVSIA